MGHKKRTPQTSSKSSPAAPRVEETGSDGLSTVRNDQNSDIHQRKNKNEQSESEYSAIKLECERALTAFRRGNHTKAIRLMKEASSRHETSGLIYRVQGTVNVKIAAIMDDPNAKQRHLNNAIESARKAVELAPNSIEFGLFYANLLYEAGNGGKEYKEVVQECERALSIENPTDPAKESLLDENQQKVLTADARIELIQNELRSLIQKANISSISTWMKNFGNGEEKFRLIPITKSAEDPMEVSLSQAQRPNEIKKVTKTEEERRKDVEVQVAAARLLQQKSELPESKNDKDMVNVSLDSPSLNSQKLGKRRKSEITRRNTNSAESKNLVRLYWNSMSTNMKKELLRIKIYDLKAHYSLLKDDLANEVLSESLSFAKANKMWDFFMCCRCSEKFLNLETHMQHLMLEHMGNLSPRMESILPQNVDNEWIDMILNCSWKPLDLPTAAEMLENQKDCDNNSHDQNRGSIEYPLVHHWPLSDDLDREKLLERIHAMFKVLIRHKYLAASHLTRVMQFTMDELQGLASGSQLLNCGVDQSPICICFLGATQLKKIHKYLQELSHSCGLGQYSDKNIDFPIDEIAQGSTQISEFEEKIVFNDDESRLILDEQLLFTEPNSDILLTWIYKCPAIGEQLLSWVRSREEKTHQAMETLQLLEKFFYQLQSLCERKSEHLSYEEALQVVEDLCIDEGKKRAKENITEIPDRSYKSVLRKRRDLIESENDVMMIINRFELEAISNVLKETEALKVNQVDTCIEIVIQMQKEQLSVELSKTDARIMRVVTVMHQLERKLELISLYDYRQILIPMVKIFMQAHLEDMAEKDATNKSDAAREAFLAELGLDSKQEKEKAKDNDKKKNKEYKKNRESKVTEQHTLQNETSEPIEGDTDSEVAVSVNDDSLKEQEEEFKRKTEFEAEERKLEETLEYQRRIENEAKQRRLAEQHNKINKAVPEKVDEGLPILYSKTVADDEDPLEQLHMRTVGMLLMEHVGTVDHPGQVTATNDANKADLFGTGLKNEVGEYNCFLNVIIQSLWHIRKLRDEFLKRPIPDHVHIGDPCVVCALYDIFTALSVSSTDTRNEAVAPTSLRIALSNLYPDSNFFQEAQMNDASEVLAVIFDCLHESFTSNSVVPDTESTESNFTGSWDCTSNGCMSHSLFGMDIYEQMNCHDCGLESRHLKYSSFFHNINASALRTMKVTCAESSFDELLNLVQMNHHIACDIETGGCGKLNHINHFLSTPPHVFITVLGWQNTCESAEVITSTLAALTTEIDIGVLYRGLDTKNRHCLVSVVCYYGQHYHCFAYTHKHGSWIMYDDSTVKVIGGWDDVLHMCKKGHLQPQVLFFEAVN